MRKTLIALFVLALMALWCMAQAPSYISQPGGSGSGGVWGAITGTLSSQTDLVNALALKAALISPSFTTPTLGAAVATSLNKITLTYIGYIAP